MAGSPLFLSLGLTLILAQSSIGEATNCTKDHEWYTDCYYGQCGPKSCEDLTKSLGCPFIAGPCPGGCICEQGYLRNSEGLCIKQENCPPQPCHVNETWMSPCNAPCPLPRCPTDNLPPPPCHDIRPCYPGCQCKPGYLRNLNSVNRQCILASECRRPLDCKGKHERYSDCLLGECVAKTCEHVGYPIPCPGIVPPCDGGCICEHGYVRDSNGDCIDMKTCPCRGDPNATSGCGNPCGKTCASLTANMSESICPGQCEYKGCDCKPGFVFLSEETRKCVPEKECLGQA